MDCGWGYLYYLASSFWYLIQSPLQVMFKPIEYYNPAYFGYGRKWPEEAISVGLLAHFQESHQYFWISLFEHYKPSFILIGYALTLLVFDATDYSLYQKVSWEA